MFEQAINSTRPMPRPMPRSVRRVSTPLSPAGRSFGTTRCGMPKPWRGRPLSWTPTMPRLIGYSEKFDRKYRAVRSRERRTQSSNRPFFLCHLASSHTYWYVSLPDGLAVGKIGDSVVTLDRHIVEISVAISLWSPALGPAKIRSETEKRRPKPPRNCGDHAWFLRERPTAFADAAPNNDANSVRRLIRRTGHGNSFLLNSVRASAVIASCAPAFGRPRWMKRILPALSWFGG